MAQQTGSTTKLVIDTETAYKTAPASPDGAVLPFTSESIAVDRALLSSRTIRSSRNPQMPVRGRMNVAGDINLELSPEYGRLMKHIFGGYGVVGGASPYTHTYKIGTLPVGLMIEKQFPDLDTAKYFQYNGCKVGSFKFSAKPEGFVDASVSIIGAKETVASSPHDATLTDLGHTPFDGFEAVITRGGNPLTDVVTEIELTLENALDDSVFAIGGAGQRAALREGIARVTGRMVSFFANTTLYDLAVASTETTLQVDFTHGTGVGTVGNEKLTFKMDEMKFSPKSPVIAGPTGLLVDLSFEAYYRVDADVSALMAILLSPNATF
jgi:hypothetical protein